MILGCVSIQAWPSSSSRRVWAKRSGTKKSFRDRPYRIRKWKSRRPTKGLFTWLNARIAEEHVSKVMYPPFPCERSFESKGIIKGVITATMILRRKEGGKNLLGGSFSSRTRVDTRSSNNFDGKISFTMLLFEDDQKRIQEFVDILKGREKMLEN